MKQAAKRRLILLCSILAWQNLFFRQKQEKGFYFCKNSSPAAIFRLHFHANDNPAVAFAIFGDYFAVCVIVRVGRRYSGHADRLKAAFDDAVVNQLPYDRTGPRRRKFPIGRKQPAAEFCIVGMTFYDNTEAFVQGKKANNVLLFGDSGTGKSTSIKAIVNQYYKDGLRMIEIYKHQFKYLSEIIAEIKNRNYRFIIYMDDLSFEEFEIEYKFLKAVIEGGVETKPENILIYATSNRRHLIKESWNDRNDQDNSNDRHHSDTVEEKLSLVNRFGVTINYSKPTQKEYFDIVLHLARRAGVTLPDEELRAEANKWELSHGGISGRTAEQFVSYLASQPDAFK